VVRVLKKTQYGVEEHFVFFSSLRSDDLRDLEDSFRIFSFPGSEDSRQFEDSFGIFSSFGALPLRKKRI